MGFARVADEDAGLSDSKAFDAAGVFVEVPLVNRIRPPGSSEPPELLHDSLSERDARGLDRR